MTDIQGIPAPRRAKRIVALLVDDLLLDAENPRLAEEGRSLSEDKLLAKLYSTEALDELAMSFARSGYFWEEPLVVVRHRALAGKYVVVEGNRRLAALKILLSPAKRAELHATDFPDLDDSRREELQAVPTVEYESRSEVVPYLGFRHITGAKKWEPYAKARYVSQLVEDGRPLGEIESSIGDGALAVRKLYQAYVVYKQIRDDLDEDVQNVRENFSLLEVTLGQVPVKNHLGLPQRLPAGPVSSLVDAGHMEELREVVRWVFGSRREGIRPVIADSREISKWLAPVLSHAESLDYLRQSNDLQASFERSGGERDFVLKQISQSRRAAGRALELSPHFSGDTGLILEAERLKETADALLGILRV